MRKINRPVFMYRFDLIELVKKTLEAGLELESIVCGNSMEPTAFNGDRVLIKPITPFIKICPGMIVAMISEDNRHFVLHRVISVDWATGTIVEKGDNCKSEKTVPISSIKGVVCCINNKEI